MSVVTVQRAYEYLARADLIHARRSKGYFVSANRPVLLKELARKRLNKNALPVINTALSEGLSVPEVKETLNQLVDRKSKDKDTV